MQFTTPTELPKDFVDISHKSKLLLAGSCFAENIGKKMAERKFDIDINPFGILYNPLSISKMLETVVAGESYTASSPLIFGHNGKWHSIMHHGCFSRDTKEELLSCINSRLESAHKRILECDTLILTYGTAYVYTRNSDGNIAGNCHKLPGNMFTRRLATVDEIADSTINAISNIHAANPKVKIIFTVSPIRHLRDGAHDNQKSKATLLLAIDEIVKRLNGNAFYFPAYEIMLDELRDYRFYAEDMIHPSPIAIDYIWECWERCCFNESTRKLNEEIEEINRSLAHRPFSPQADAYKKFLLNTIEKITALNRRHPYLDFDNEIRQCNTVLNR